MTDDQYADAEFKDRTDFLGSSDSSLEQGVIAVGVAVVLWLFFRAFFLPFVLLALLYLFVRIFIGKTDPKALLGRIAGLWDGARNRVARTKVRLIVEMIPDQINDAEAVYAWCFPTPYAEQAQETFRRMFVAYVFERMPKKHDTLSIVRVNEDTGETQVSMSDGGRKAVRLVDVLTQLAEWGDDPLHRMLQATIRRRIAPSTQPKPQGLAGVNAFAAPIPGLGMMTQYLAVALVVVGAWGVWGWRAKGGAERKEAAAIEALQTAESRNEGLATAIKQRDEAMRQMNVNMEDYQNRVAAMQRQDAAQRRALAAAQQKERERVEQARARADGSGPQLSDDDWLRNAATLIGPSSGGSDSRPAEPAANPAEGVAGGVPGTVEPAPAAGANP